MARRTYQNDDIKILWDSSYCIHSARCIQTGDGVFDPNRRPWVDVNESDTETIVAAIENCPTGALRYERLDGSPGEQPAPTTTVVPYPNGPLFVRGEVEVRDRHGDVFVVSPRVALCRCGLSQNQPFCDLSHRGSEFKDQAKAPVPERDAAANPAEISETTL